MARQPQFANYINILYSIHGHALYDITYKYPSIITNIPIPSQNLFLLSRSSHLGALRSGLYCEQCYINFKI